METVRHRGLTVTLAHPALWIEKGRQIVRDLIDVLTHEQISPACLAHLIASRDRLVGGRYETFDGRGCLMYVLTERLSTDKQIRTKQDLARFFGRAKGRPAAWGYVAPKDSPEYQPAKWLVRLVDGQICSEARSRYGRSAEFFDYELVLDVAQQVLAHREAAWTKPRPAIAMAGR